jgi:hypothetical protein
VILLKGRILSAFLLLILTVIGPATGLSRAAPLKDWITNSIDNSNVTALAGSVHPRTSSASEQGIAENTKVLTMSISFPAQPGSASEPEERML